MIVIDPGHQYELANIDEHMYNVITFVKRFRGSENHGGTTNQELLRVLIDRVAFLDAEKPWPLNAEIIKHLQMALVLHEARAMIRKVEKDEILPETLAVDPVDGHYVYKY